MTARPTDLTDWANNTNYSTGTAVGTPTKVTAGATQLADGWYPGQLCPPMFLNRWMNAAHSWIRYLRDPTEASSTLLYPLASRSLTKFAKQFFAAKDFTSAPTAVLGAGAYSQSSLATDTFVAFELDVPVGAILHGLHVYVKGGGSHSALPATMPVLRLITVVPSTGTIAQYTGAMDSTGTFGAYDLLHPITISLGGSPITADRTTRLVAVLDGESGANSTTSLSVYGVDFTFDTTGMDDGAA